MLTKRELKKAIAAELPRLYYALGKKLKDAEILDLGLAGFSLTVRIKHPKVAVLTVSAPIPISSTLEEVIAEVDNLIETINSPDLDAKIEAASVAGAALGADEIFANDVPGVSIVEVFTRFASLGISPDQVFFLVEQSKIDAALLLRLNAFLDEGAEDDFGDFLGNLGKKPSKPLQ